MPPDQDVVPSGWARVSYIRDSPDGRRFVNDSRGFLYLLDRKQSVIGVRGRGEALSFGGRCPIVCACRSIFSTAATS